MTERPSWSSYFLDIAKTVATRSTCSRLSVGAVAVLDRRILATGYNGAPVGHPHCNHVTNDRCQIAVHAEANVVASAAKHGVPLNGCTVYVTHLPCTGCLRLMKNAGVHKIVYANVYGDLPGSEELAKTLDIELWSPVDA